MPKIITGLIYTNKHERVKDTDHIYKILFQNHISVCATPYQVSLFDASELPSLMISREAISSLLSDQWEIVIQNKSAAMFDQLYATFTSMLYQANKYSFLIRICIM